MTSVSDHWEVQRMACLCSACHTAIPNHFLNDYLYLSENANDTVLGGNVALEVWHPFYSNLAVAVTLDGDEHKHTESLEVNVSKHK